MVRVVPPWTKETEELIRELIFVDFDAQKDLQQGLELQAEGEDLDTKKDYQLKIEGGQEYAQILGIELEGKTEDRDGYAEIFIENTDPHPEEKK